MKNLQPELSINQESSQSFTDHVSLNIDNLDDWPHQQAIIEELRRELPRLMWHSAGICRGQKALEEAIAQVELWREKLAALPLSQKLLKLKPGQTLNVNFSDRHGFDLRAWGEIYNLLDVGYLILKSASFRAESRGGHFRLDYPLSDPYWCSHTLVKYEHWSKSPIVNNP
jgi:L-aspartate oxidase